jgi:hypothetical protein
MTYPDLFKRGVALWWRTRGLWALGVLAALFGASDYSASGLNVNSSVSSDQLPPGFADAWASNPLVRAFLDNPLPFILGAVALGLLFALLSALVGQLAHGAMIRMADVADRGLEPSLGDALRVGAERLLPMFLLGIVLALPALLAFLAAIGVGAALVFQLVGMVQAGGQPDPTAVLLGLGGSLLCLVPLLLAGWLLGLALGLFGRFAQRVCVLEGRGPIASLRRAWGLVTRNFGAALLNWLATLVLGAIFGFLAALPALAIALPAVVGFSRSGEVPWAALAGLAVYALAANALLGGWLTSLNSALWTVLYRAFRAREQEFAVPASFAPGD